MTMADMDYDVIIVSPIDGTNLITGTLEIYMCVSDKEADA